MAAKEDPKNVVTIPVDTINEQVIIAAALVDDQIREQHVPKEPADQFADDDHGLIWDAMRTVLQRGKGFDMQQLHAEISGKVKLEYLQQLVQRYPKPPVNMAQHMSQLHWDYVRRTAAEESVPDFLRALKDPKQSPAMVKGMAERVTRSLDAKLDRSFMSNPKLLATKQREQIRKRTTGMACYPYGIHELDFFKDGRPRCIPGAAPGFITVLTGASGSGKSALAAKIALQQARRARRSLYGAWEMGGGPTLEMMAVMSYTTPLPGMSECPALQFPGAASRSGVATGKLTEEELDDLHARMEAIAEWVRFFDPPFHHDPSKVYTNEQSLAEIYRMVADSGCELVIYDLWERCIPDGAPGPERRALFTQQAIHQRTNTHGILVSQQKIKEIERRPDRRPSREAILGSSAWVEIADELFGTYRVAHSKAVPDDTMEVLILKQRHGRWPMAVQFDWDGDQMSMLNGREVSYDFAGDSGKGSVF